MAMYWHTTSCSTMRLMCLSGMASDLLNRSTVLMSRMTGPRIDVSFRMMDNSLLQSGRIYNTMVTPVSIM